MSDTTEPTSMYGQNKNGRKLVIGEAEIWVDDDFAFATLLAIVTVLNSMFDNFDEIVSTVAAGIYDEIQKNRPE